jgi:hypothetical protein
LIDWSFEKMLKDVQSVCEGQTGTSEQRSAQQRRGGGRER